MDSLFGPLISAYSRADALSDGQLIDISTLARELGFRWPVAVTAALWHGYLAPPANLIGLTWDVLSVLRWAMRRVSDPSELRCVVLTAHCGPGDEMDPVMGYGNDSWNFGP